MSRAKAAGWAALPAVPASPLLAGVPDMAMSGWRSPGGEGSDEEPLSLPPEESPGAAALLETRNLLRILVAAVVIAALQVARDVFIPVILAVILSFVLSPLVNLLGRAGLRRVAAVVVSVVLALGLLGLVGTLIGRQAAGLAADAPRYARTIEQKIEGLQTLFAARVSAISTALGIGRPPTPAPAASAPAANLETPAGPAGATRSKAPRAGRGGGARRLHARRGAIDSLPGRRPARNHADRVHRRRSSRCSSARTCATGSSAWPARAISTARRSPSTMRGSVSAAISSASSWSTPPSGW